MLDIALAFLVLTAEEHYVFLVQFHCDTFISIHIFFGALFSWFVMNCVVMCYFSQGPVGLECHTSAVSTVMFTALSLLSPPSARPPLLDHTGGDKKILQNGTPCDPGVGEGATVALLALWGEVDGLSSSPTGNGGTEDASVGIAKRSREIDRLATVAPAGKTGLHL